MNIFKQSATVPNEPGDPAKSPEGSVFELKIDHPSGPPAANQTKPSIVEATAHHVNVEQASELLRNQLCATPGVIVAEAPQPAGRQATANRARYSYYVPANLPAVLTTTYHHTMDNLLATHAKLTRDLAAWLGQPADAPARRRANRPAHSKRRAERITQAVLPLALTGPLHITLAAEQRPAVYLGLQADDLPEIRSFGKRLEQTDSNAAAANGPASAESNRADHQVFADLTTQLVVATYTPEDSAINLSRVAPRNELAVVPTMLYEYGDQPLRELQATVDTWPYEQRAEVFQTYLAAHLAAPGGALANLHYDWDIVSDYSTFHFLISQQLVQAPQWQYLTPRLGYAVPEVIEAAGLSDDFEACFDASLQLHSHLQQAGFRHEAQYAILRGHRLRWHCQQTAAYITRLQTAKRAAPPAARQLADSMLATLGEVHPLFVNSLQSGQRAT